MKKKLLIAILLLLAVTLTVTVSAKYIAEQQRSLELSAGAFYFRSNVLTDEEPATQLTVRGRSTELLLANGADSRTFSDRDIAYTVTYAVQIEGAWTTVASETVTGSLPKGALQTATLTVTPLTVDGVLYNTVQVTAKSTSPQAKTLQAELTFVYSGYTLAYEYDREVGVITMIVTTNDDSGSFTVAWENGLLPDNADPNGLLTAGGEGYDSLELTLNAHTVYRLNFFVDSSLRAFVDEQINSIPADRYDEMLAELIEQGVSFSKN